MWQHEAASRAAIENGREEGLGYSTESAPFAFPQDIQMEENLEPARNNAPAAIRRYEDQMVSSMTSSLVRAHNNNTFPQFNFPIGVGTAEDSTAESSSSSIRRERDGGVVPVWYPPASSYSEQFIGDENGIGASLSYLQRHPQSHQIVNWRCLSRIPQQNLLVVALGERGMEELFQFEASTVPPNSKLEAFISNWVKQIHTEGLWLQNAQSCGWIT
ncbi:hypothetical protein CRYUN_Cryun35bG0056200 [Craigia yunnanensis]